MLPLENLSNEDYEDIDRLYQYLINELKTKTFKENEYRDFKRALTIAYSAHKGQKRETTNEPYINHPIAVSIIASNEIGLGATSIICALLHDVVEDNPNFKLEYLEQQFSKNVSDIVDGLTKIKVNSKDKGINEQASTFAKILTSIPKDLRIILIKLSDKVHNMRTMDGLSDNKLVNKAAETLHIYAPLAFKLGLYLIKNELENLSFKYLHKPEYDQLSEKINKIEEQNHEMFDQLSRQITSILTEMSIDFITDIAHKSLYSIWQKLEVKKMDLSSLHNFRSIQIILNTNEKDDERELCYRVYLQLTGQTQLFQLDYTSIKDYIIIPRSNGFQALIFNLMAKGQDDWTEIQIMTQRMKDIGDRGYPSEKFSDFHKSNTERQKWITRITQQLQDPESNALDFLRDFSGNFIASEIQVISPKNEIIKLPKGASVLDYAFTIHRDLGLTCDGAIVNRIRVGRDYVLNRSDKIQILTSPQVEPHQSWFNIVITGQAKHMLRGYFSKQKRIIADSGQAKLSQMFNDFGIEPSKEVLSHLITQFDMPDVTQLYYNIGNNTVTAEKLYQKIKDFLSQNNSRFSFFGFFSPKKKKAYPFRLDETTDHHHLVYAKCCNPIPGDDAIAYRKEEGIIFIHSRRCNNTIFHGANEKRNVALVEWGNFKSMRFLVRIMLTGSDRTGLLADIAHVIYEQAGMNMHSVNISAPNETFNGEIQVEVHNKAELDSIMDGLKKIPGMNRIVRLHD